MVVFVGGGSLMNLLSTDSVEGGRIFDKSVSSRELKAMARRLFAFQPRQGLPEHVLIAKSWDLLILNEEAKRYGIEVSDADILNYLKQRFPAKSGGGLDDAAYQAHLQQLRLPQPEYERGLKAMLTAQFLQKAVVNNVTLPKEEAWLWYSRDDEKIKVRYTQLRAEDLARLVKFEEQELKDFYQKHADIPQGQGAGRPGYQEPEKVQIEYVLAPFKKYAAAAKVADKQIKDYYEANKKNYLLPKKGKKQADKEDKSKREESKAEETDEKEAPPAYKPLAMVKKDIEKKLRDDEAKRKVKEVMKEVNEEIWKVLDAPFGSEEVRAVDMKALAKKFGLLYRQTGFFSRSEVGTILPGAFKLAEKAFGQGTSAIGQPKPVMKAGDGEFIFQIVDSRPPQPAPFESAKKQVEKDLRLDRGFRLAGRIALAANGAENLDAAEKIIEEKVAELIKKAPGKDGADAGKVQKKTPEKPTKGEDAKSFFSRGESKFFARPREYRNPWTGRFMRHHYGTGLPGRFDYQRSADEAFRLKAGQVGLAEEPGPQGAFFLLERVATKLPDRAEFDKNAEQISRRLLVKKQEAALNTWRRDLRRRAKPSSSVLKYLVVLPEWSEAIAGIGR